MKKRITSFLLLIVFVFILSSCKNIRYIQGEGEVITKEKALNNDTSLVVENIFILNDDETINPVNVNIHFDLTKKIAITAQESILDYIQIDETLGILTIFSESNIQFRTGDITIDIYGCSFTNITANLSVVTCNTFASNFTLNLKKASRFISDSINTKSLSATLDYSCQLDVKRMRLTDFSMVLSNKSKANIDNLKSQNLNIQSSGALCNIVASSIEVNSKYNLTGNSSLSVSGTSTTMDVTITGCSSYFG